LEPTLLPVLCTVLALAAIGLLSGYVGIGGGVLIIPLFTWLGVTGGIGALDAHNVAKGTTLVVSCLTALSGHLVHRRKADPGRSTLPLAAGVAVSAFVGGRVAVLVLGPAMLPLFGVAALLAAAGFVLRREGGRTDPLPGGFRAFLLGLPIGFCAALFGLGGAIFTGLVFSGILGYPMRRVVVATTLAQVFGAATGSIAYALGGSDGVEGIPLLVGYVHLPTALVAAAVTWPLARMGAHLTHRTPPLGVRVAFAAILVVIGLRFLLG